MVPTLIDRGLCQGITPRAPACKPRSGHALHATRRSGSNLDFSYPQAVDYVESGQERLATSVHTNHQKRWRFSDLVERARRLQPRRERTPGGMTATELMVMMPMDIIAVGEVSDGVESTVIHLASHNSKVLDAQLKALRDEGVAGIMVDVWWGICERHGPQEYDFNGYMTLFKKMRRLGLKVQAVMSFHQGGGNVGDGSVHIPLPSWVLEAGEALEDEIFFTDKDSARDHECLSLGCDHEPVLHGRTPIQAYQDFVEAFISNCLANDLWGSTVCEVMVGLGPCGELRYPAYQEADSKWSYFGPEMFTASGMKVQRGIPGIGEFQCFDRYMLEDLARAAAEAGHPEWGIPPTQMPGFGPGAYDFAPWETEFFAISQGAGFEQPYGHFFMEWYSGKLVQHCADVLDAVIPVIRAADQEVHDNHAAPVQVAIKVAGIHWWYKSRSHPAEMTAGYYNYYGHDGYAPIMKAVAQRDVWVAFTCIEMSDSENPDLRHCSPEGLVRQVVSAAEHAGAKLMAENALEGGLYSEAALTRMLGNSKHFSTITLLRLNDSLFLPAFDGADPDELIVRQPLKSFLNNFLAAQQQTATTTSNGGSDQAVHQQQDAAAAQSSVWVHSTRTCRALTRTDVRGEAKQTDRRQYETVSNIQSPPHTY
eukprot:jgi/Chrzof1/14779/Cz09g15250.t1